MSGARPPTASELFRAQVRAAVVSLLAESIVTLAQVLAGHIQEAEFVDGEFRPVSEGK